MQEKISVLGAGMVGICCALELQRRGFQVTLIDRRGPGEETSFGNAGILSYSNITPLASPELLARIHRLLLNRDTDFLLHYPHLIHLLPWLVRFALRCTRKTFLKDGQLMAALTLPSIKLHEQWIAECKQQHLLSAVGALKLYRNQQTFMRDELERELYDYCEVKYSILEADQIRDREPGLRDIFVKGVMIDETPSINNPGKLCKVYADFFVNLGGKIRRAEIKSLNRTNNSWCMVSEQGEEAVEKLVVCLGAWTPGILKSLGYANPMAIERGYHTVLEPVDNNNLSRPFFDVDASYVMAPMEMGLRVSSGSNLTYRETRPTPLQIDRVLPRVREAFPVGQILLDKPWMGRRPSVPDTLPIIGPAPRHKNLWLAFAHSHMGFTMGPITAKLIANFIDGSEQPFSPKAYAPGRYL